MRFQVLTAASMKMNHPDDAGSTRLWNVSLFSDTTQHYIPEGYHIHSFKYMFKLTEQWRVSILW
jgi:hypothetical protein